MSQPGSEIDWEDVPEDGSGDELVGPTALPASAPTTIGSWSHLPRPDLIVPEAFESGPMCIPRQIAAATEEKLDTVLRRFDDIMNGQGWRELPKQFTPLHIIQYAADIGVSVYIYLGSRL